MIGNVCVDINECSSAHGCQHECLNQLGSYACVCNPGFTLQPDGKTCLDTDECEPGHGCQHACLNQNGNYVCACNVGYQLDEDGKTCRDIDECLNGNNGGCQQVAKFGGRGNRIRILCHSLIILISISSLFRCVRI